jgi:lysine-specific demethylase/histidyl-hydroxylase NO66
LNSFCVSLEKFFGFQCGVNSYLTPMNSQGFALHHDTQEAFIVQVSGRKAWRICGAWPKQTIARWHEQKPTPNDDVAAPCSIIILHPGDTLYVPRGVLHETTTNLIKSHDESFHLTFGLEGCSNLFKDMFARAHHDMCSCSRISDDV